MHAGINRHLKAIQVTDELSHERQIGHGFVGAEFLDVGASHETASLSRAQDQTSRRRVLQ